MPRWLNAAIGMLMLLYPAAVYFGLRYLEPRWIAAALAGLLAARLALAGQRWMRQAAWAGLAFAAFAVWSNQVLTLRFYPVAVNAAMLAIFGVSLLRPPSLIERLARLQTPDLPAAGVIYTRRVTALWCGFFVLNGTAALVTALYASFEVWSLYNGLIAYLLMGLLLLGEYGVRRRAGWRG